MFVLEPLTVEQVIEILRRALTDEVHGQGARADHADDDTLSAMAVSASGDARTALTMLELAARSAPVEQNRRHISRAWLERALQRRILRYDKGGEEHYDLISALHKCMRNAIRTRPCTGSRHPGSRRGPALVARRLVRFASEDVGNADPQALTVAVAAQQAAHFIGMPEGNTALAQAAIYLATAPKSNAVLVAYGRAADDAERQVAEPVPLHLRNAPTKLMKQLDYGKDYQYAHDQPDAVADMDCLPASLRSRTYYEPKERGFEKEIREGWRGGGRSRGREGGRRRTRDEGRRTNDE